jgi:hypothetical protein
MKGLERCNRPAWRYYPNGYRVCRDHAVMNDPHQMMADNPVGPCDYALDGKGAMSFNRRIRESGT